MHEGDIMSSPNRKFEKPAHDDETDYPCIDALCMAEVTDTLGFENKNVQYQSHSLRPNTNRLGFSQRIDTFAAKSQSRF
jgi:hypothetical protein